jgi:pSer/pThr/pTyr-binding forkhead associated (FHA) protein/CRP-like cAMP-binding protein/Pyruvate/2-oxoacid:ferredoxin oxidoreductase delta subunit
VARFEDRSLPFANASGLWQPAVKQGLVAGLDMAEPAADPPHEYRPGAIYNATRVWDLDLGALGDHVDGPGEPVVWRETSGPVPVYKRALLREGRVVGALLLGDRREGGALRRLMNLRGAASDVSAVAARLFDPEFDLFAWVAAQERAPGTRRHDHDVALPGGALPAGLLRSLTQRGLVRPVEGRTAAFNSLPPPPLHLSVDGRPVPVSGSRVRIAGRAPCDVRVEEAGVGDSVLTLALEGMVWMALRRRRDRTPVARNGRLLTRRAALVHGDVLRFGAARIVIGLGAPAPAGPPGSAPEAFLLGPRERHPLPGGTLRVGSDRDNDLVFRAHGLRPFHAQVRQAADGGWDVLPAAVDAEVRVGEARVEAHRRLRSGDVITLSSLRLTFQLAGALPARGADATTAHGAGAVTWTLTATTGPLCGRVFAVPAGETVGRGPEAGLRIDDPLLSAVHARFDLGPDGLALVDLGSTNGTAVNGEALEPDVPVALSEGAELRLGRHTFRLARSGAGQAPPDDAPMPREHAGGATMLLARDACRLEEQQEGAPAIHPLLDELVRLGRGRENEIVVARSDISREHCRFSRREQGYAVTDCDSTFGTQVNGQALEPWRQRALQDGDVIEVGSRRLVYRREAARPGTPPPARENGLVARLRPVGEAGRPAGEALPLSGSGPWVLGRDRRQCSLHVDDPEKTVSRTHALIERAPDGSFAVRNQSRNGTTCNGAPVPSDKAVPLRDGDLLVLQVRALRFQVEREAAEATARHAPLRSFLEEEGGSNPLEADLARTVRAEVESCIGCHECMRACPLPEATSVGIGALNAYASGVGQPDELTLRFVRDCTQCHACVPVCPADLRRSRMVLWNKLKSVPDEKAPLSLQVGEQQVAATSSLGAVLAPLEQHPVFGKLPRTELRRLLVAARLRQLRRGETLLGEGRYPDAMWVLLEGRLELSTRTTGRRRLRLVTLSPGQTVAERALFSDLPMEHDVRAEGRALVVGFSKYALAQARALQPPFSAALEGLYLSRSREAALARLGLAPEAAAALGDALRPERHRIGRVLLDRAEAADCFGIVARGFVREVRRRGARERIANYLKPGDVLGGPDRGGAQDVLLRYEAATQVELFTIRRASLERLEEKHEGVLAALLPPARPGTTWAADASGAFASPGGTGILQAQRLLVIDTRACVDCDNCVQACGRRHGTPRLERQNAGLQQGVYQVPASCYHCVDPLCLFCSVNGIVREPSGEIRIVEENCVGCGACAERCPYDNIFMQPRAGLKRPLLRRLLPDPILRLLHVRAGKVELEDFERVAVKCDLCVGHRDGPACVRACPTGAALRADPIELFGLGRGAPA